MESCARCQWGRGAPLSLRHPNLSGWLVWVWTERPMGWGQGGGAVCGLCVRVCVAEALAWVGIGPLPYGFW